MRKLSIVKLALISLSLVPFSLVSVKIWEIHLHFGSDASASNTGEGKPAKAPEPKPQIIPGGESPKQPQPENANFSAEELNGSRKSWLITLPKDNKWHQMDLEVPPSATYLEVKSEPFENDWQVGLMWSAGDSVFPPMWHIEPPFNSFGIPLSKIQKGNKIGFRNQRTDGKVIKIKFTFVGECETLGQLPSF